MDNLKGMYTKFQKSHAKYGATDKKTIKVREEMAAEFLARAFIGALDIATDADYARKDWESALRRLDATRAIGRELRLDQARVDRRAGRVVATGHLHFEVARLAPGGRATIPVTFVDVTSFLGIPRMGLSYASGNPAPAPTDRPGE